MRTIYLAGPDVFRKDATDYLQGLKDLCSQYGFIGLSPLDNEIEPTATNQSSMSNAIFSGNIQLLNECDIVIANLNPFRGPNVDDGTAFEIGFAGAKGKIIYGYTFFNKTTLKQLTSI